ASLAADEAIVSPPSPPDAAAIRTRETVVILPPFPTIIAVAALQQVVPAAADEDVIAVAAYHGIVAVAGVDAIVAVAGIDQIVARSAAQVIIAIGSRHDLAGFGDVGDLDAEVLRARRAMAVGRSDGHVVDIVAVGILRRLEIGRADKVQRTGMRVDREE